MDAAASGADGLTEPLLALSPKALWQAFKAEHFAFIAIAIYLLLEYTKPDLAYPILGILPFLRLSWMAALLGFFLDKRARVPGSPLNWLLVLFFAQCALFAGVITGSIGARLLVIAMSTRHSGARTCANPESRRPHQLHRRWGNGPIGGSR